MAFSMRAGTQWCHDFPKLARESGFYFNVHRTPVRIDWNRISTIDIERLMRERDFLTIDENVNNVVDYSLESAYDIKILDPNFVKIFRLAQLSVEYLLYCRQYLDQSVIILKDDLKLRLEENHKLKRELSTADEQIKDLKEKSREKHKWLEKKFSDSSGEIHKCPHCPKTFISSVFMTSHMTRRHSTQSLPTPSPVHEEYRAEAEKLHNEIKTLKERLNETERIIRSESGKLHESISNTRVLHSRKIESNDRQKIEEEYEKYREEMSNLRSILFSEVRNIEGTERKHWDKHDERNELVKQLGEEIQRLRDQLQTQAFQISDSQSKLNTQENQYWQSKIQELEKQHQLDIQRLNQQLILNQQTTEKMRMDYTSKIVQLEEKSRNYVDTVVQRESHETGIVQAIRDVDTSDTETDAKVEGEGKRGEIESKKKEEFPIPSEISSEKKRQNFAAEPRRIEVKEVYSGDKNPKAFERRNFLEQNFQKSVDRSGIQSRNFDGDRLDEEETSLGGENSESETVSESQISQSESGEDESDGSGGVEKGNEKSPEETKMEIQGDFDQRLRGLGVDPEWTGIPPSTYRQLLATMAHHRALSAKKHRNFKQMRQQISEKLSSAASKRQILPKSCETSSTKSPLNRLMSNVTSKAIMGLKVLKKDNKPKFLLREKANIMKLQTDLLPRKLDEVAFRERGDADRKEDSSMFSPVKFSSPRYVSSPQRQVDPSRQLFHSYESIGDYGKDSLGRFQGQTSNPILTSTHVSQGSPNISGSQGKLGQIASLPGSPKNNKSLLKPMTGSVGSLIKKKVLFDLDNTEETENNYSKSSQVSSIFENSDDGVSSISGEPVDETPGVSKIQQRDRRIEVKSRQQPVGGVSLCNNEVYEEILAKSAEKMTIPPQPAPRASTSVHSSLLSKNFSGSKESNLDFDIEELLRMD
ncbi:zinc finger protein DZIP1 [Diachasma alloeum]|uniref:zinc finger protein DZIP1 n=1 Tax=Diachasma alloeum TaxID=454923 RepID=UPI000738132E|nr:zinc finger protein DZIP1 [Diachasma alloeum]